MTVEIKTLYLGMISYRIAVIADGELLQTYPATVGDVASKVCQLCEYWSHHADQVTPGEIPDATEWRDMKRKLTKGQTQ